MLKHLTNTCQNPTFHVYQKSSPGGKYKQMKSGALFYWFMCSAFYPGEDQGKSENNKYISTTDNDTEII